MKKEIGCINSCAVIRYIENKAPDKLDQLFENLGPEMAGIADPKVFLSDFNNWISSSLMVELFRRASRILGDENAAFHIGYDSVVNRDLGYIQNIFLYAFGNPSRVLKHIQRMNYHFNKTKKISVVKSGRNNCIVRLKWLPDVEVTADCCLMNKGIYQAVPRIWGLPSAKLNETSCFFKGGDYCEYHIKWKNRRPLRDFFRSLFTPWEVARESIAELERDKEVLRDKYNHIHQLNLDLQHKVDQLTSLEESSTAILSTLELEKLLDLILKKLLSVAKLDRAGIFLLNEGRDHLVLIHAVGVEDRLFADLKGYQIPLAKMDNIIARTVRNQKLVVVRDVDSLPLNRQNLLLRKLNPKAFILVPITVKGKVVGIMVGDNKENGNTMADIDQNFLASFANHIAMALENATLYKKLEDSEARYREMVENANEGILVVDKDGTIEYSNKCLGDMLEYDELNGIPIYNLVDERDKKALLRLLLKNMEGVVAKDEIILQTKSGEHINVLLSSVPILSEDRFEGCLSMVTDLTEKKQMESRLLQAQKLEAIGTMAGGIAHDFNNILTGILGYTMLLKQKSDVDSDVRRYADIIEKSGERAADLVRKLLAFSRDSKVGEARGSKVKAVVQDAMELLQSSMPKNIDMDISIRTGLPLIECDPTQLQQVILNMCINARDAMPDGGRIRIEAEEAGFDQMSLEYSELAAQNGRYVCIRISDTGTGMDSRTKERIFDPFFTTKEVGKGSGLGLAMVYGVVKGCGGSVSVHSEIGKGTDFRLYFPVVEDVVDVVDSPSDGHRLNGSETVLVVDDEEMIRELALELLSSRGYHVMLAKDGLEAVHIYKVFGHNIDVILMDLAMPGMGGKEAYEKLKEMNPQVKVLFCSGHGSGNRGIEDIWDESHLPFICKPFKLDELLQMLRQVLDGRTV